jgi:uncharacterized protein YndB with AHSA1/START domain
VIDPIKQTDAVSREVDEATDGHTVVLTRRYDGEPADVWDACTNAERIPRWFLPVSGELHEGGRYQLQGNAGGTIERCNPPTELAITWEFGGQVSRVQLRLSADGQGGTVLRLAHTVPDDAKWQEFGPGAVGPGWDLTLLGLASHVGDIESAGPTWMRSPDGVRFLNLVSSGWRQAQLASGADVRAAEAAAERTLAFWCPPAT